MTNADVAKVVERCENTVRKYSMRDGQPPTWDVIWRLQDWNLNQALDLVRDAFGEDAAGRLRNEDADRKIGLGP